MVGGRTRNGASAPPLTAGTPFRQLESEVAMDARAAVRERGAAHRDRLVALSHRIHAHPELAFEEERASAWCAEALDAAGFTVERRVCDLPTAFVARAGAGPLHLALCAEYDCLPGIGHACGHNLIAAMAVGAGIAAARVADELGLTIRIIGTPAEELGGGGKIILLERGAFAGAHAAMMVHPSPTDNVAPMMLANAHFGVCYTGKAAHAAAYPELGINAADALTVAQVAIGLLRQHMRPGDQVHGVAIHAGDAPNIVPARAEGDWMVRAVTVADLDLVRPRIERCFSAGALATGATVSIEELAPVYTHMDHDHALLDLYRENAVALGRTPDEENAMTFS